MPINTAQERKSVTGVGRPFLRAHGIDATKPAAWRTNTGLGYYGVSIAAPLEIGWIKWRSPRATRPSWSQGWARTPAESAYPGLWKRLVSAWAPEMGVTGNVVHNLTHPFCQLELQNMDASNWGRGQHGAYLSFNGVDEVAGAADNLAGAGIDAAEPLSLHVRMRTSTTGDNIYGLAIQVNTVTNHQMTVGISDTGEARYAVRLSSPFSEAVSSTSYTYGEWATITGVSRADGDRSVWLNGSGEGTNTDSLGSFGGADTASLGALLDLSPTYSACDVSCALYWLRALTPDEVAILARDSLAPFRLRRGMPFVSTDRGYGVLCLDQFSIYQAAAEAEYMYGAGAAVNIYGAEFEATKVGC